MNFVHEAALIRRTASENDGFVLSVDYDFIKNHFFQQIERKWVPGSQESLIQLWVMNGPDKQRRIRYLWKSEVAKKNCPRDWRRFQVDFLESRTYPHTHTRMRGYKAQKLFLTRNCEPARETGCERERERHGSSFGNLIKSRA